MRNAIAASWDQVEVVPVGQLHPMPRTRLFAKPSLSMPPRSQSTCRSAGTQVAGVASRSRRQRVGIFVILPASLAEDSMVLEDRCFPAR